jgi:hypothetical protein
LRENFVVESPPPAGFAPTTVACALGFHVSFDATVASSAVAATSVDGAQKSVD